MYQMDISKKAPLILPIARSIPFSITVKHD